MNKLYRAWLTTMLIATAAACSQGGDYSLMKEGEPYAEAVVRDVSQDWNADKLIAKADPRMLKAFPEADIRKMIADCANAVGSVKSQKTLAGQVNVETAIPGKTTLYVVELNGEKANARVRVKLQKIDAEWKVLGFWLQSQPPSLGGKPQ